MICKYCHSKNHLIDKCPTIICKNCKDIGHPQWLCKLKKNNNSSNNSSNNTNSYNNTLNLEKKYCFSDEIKKKPSNEVIIQKNINYYLKLEDKLWGNLITI